MGTSNFEALYQQNPTIPGGNLFKEAWFKYYTQHPNLKYRVIYGDTAQKTKEENDYSVFQCWGKGVDNRLYLLDQIRSKWEAPELQIQALAFWNKHNNRLVYDARFGSLNAIKIEDKVSGTGLIQTIRKMGGIPVIALQRNTDKNIRAMDTAPYIESGNAYFPQNAPWLSDYIKELSTFPFAIHDDQVDPIMDAVTDMLGNNNFTIGDIL